MLIITAVAATETTRYPFGLDPRLSLLMIGLIAGIAFTVMVGLERVWVPALVVPFGILATIASTVYRVAEVPGQVSMCGPVQTNIGFPLQYNFTYESIGSRCIVPLHSLVLAPRIDIALFSLDAIFYVAAGLAIIQLYRGITGRTINARSLLASKMA